MIILLFSAFGFAYNADTTWTLKEVVLTAKLSLLFQLVCFIDGGGINLFRTASESKQKRRRYPTTLTPATPFQLDLKATSKDATGSRDQQVLHRRGEGGGRMFHRQVQTYRSATVT